MRRILSFACESNVTAFEPFRRDMFEGYLPQDPMQHQILESYLLIIWGHAVAQLLRHCATNPKVAGSIPDSVVGIFYWHNPSGRTMSLESTQSLTDMSTRNISWGRGGRCVGLTTLSPSFRLSWNLGASASLNLQGLLRLVMGLLYLYVTYS
jgi:hypothetical protein